MRDVNSKNPEAMETEEEKTAQTPCNKDTLKTLTINLSLKIHDKLIQAALRHGCTPEELITQHLSKLLQDPSKS